MSRSNVLYVFTLCLFSNLSFGDSAPQHLYDQLLPKLVKFDIEEPSEAEVHFINICHAHNQGGTHFDLPNKELWQAVNSIAMFDIVTQYMPTITASGRIALARQYTQMNDDMTTLQHKVELQRYLQQNPSLLYKLEKIIIQTQSAEKTFAKLFKTVSEEEQAEINRINARLYFSWLPASLNENEWALGAGPRLNQMHTAAWYTIPPILASAAHGEIKLNIAKNELREKIPSDIFKYNEVPTESLEEYQNNLRKEIVTSNTELEQKIKEEKKESPCFDPGDVSYFSTGTRYDIWKLKNDLQKTQYLLDKSLKLTADNFKEAQSLQEQAQQINKQTIACKLTEFEKTLRPENSPTTDLSMAANTKVLAKAAQLITQRGITNLPNFAFDATKQTAKTLYQEATERKMYAFFRKDYPDSQAKALAMTVAGYTCITFIASIYPLILFARYHLTKELFDLIYEKQQDLFSVAHLVKSMHCTYMIIDQDPQLREILSTDHLKLKALFNPKSKETSSDLKHLVEQLLSPSFQGQASYFWSQPGKILATYQLLTRIKHELVPYLETLGNIDAYLTIQKLYLEYENHPRVTFCLPEFVNSTTPVLDISQYWHPLINPDFVVTNNLTMGTNNIKNLMITGPNAGGKTTSLMSLIINIIFAQSFGIAPSKSLTMTPFAKIHSYLDITTNLQEGLSLFAAEVDRAKKLKVSIASCTPGQKTFTIIDEIFSGTDPKVASDVGFKFAAQLGEMAHSLTIITTHFPRLTDLEKEVGTFINYKVADATIMPDGKIVYPFKLIPGISTQNIAQHMLEQQGII